MSILVVGSVAFDSVETPFGKVEDALGGSGTYFSTAASHISEVSLVAVVGEDFPEEHIEMLRKRGVNVDGVERVKGGKTFRWKGRYDYDLNQAHTLDTQLNVFSDFNPTLPKGCEDLPFVFLANIDPELQLRVLDQVKSPRLVACDTMNFWIEGKPEALRRLFKRVDLVVINESEAREFAGEASLVKAARAILELGPRALIVKRGEYGSLMFNGTSVFSAPAYPLEDIYDPTGAGDSFAGGLMGYLANTDDLSEDNMRRAIIFGSVMASFNVEAFSLDRLGTLGIEEIRSRYREFKRLTHFEDL
ncbi:MAG: PfkB family carbohydrate kinase [Thermodesulfobacteriota bacterium]